MLSALPKNLEDSIQYGIRLKLAEMYLHTAQKIQNVIQNVQVIQQSINLLQQYFDNDIQTWPGDMSSREAIETTAKQLELQVTSFLNKAEKCYPILLKKAEEMDLEQNRLVLLYKTIWCKYANFLYMTKKNDTKAIELLQKILEQPQSLRIAIVVFHKAQSLAVDDNIRSYFHNQSHFVIAPLTAMAYYLQIMIFIRQRDKQKISQVLAKLKSFAEWETTLACNVPLNAWCLLGHIYSTLGEEKKATEAFAMAEKITTPQFPSGLFPQHNFETWHGKTWIALENTIIYMYALCI